MPIDPEQWFKRGVTSVLRSFTRSLLDVDLRHFHPESILVVRQHDQLGDMLCIGPLLRALRERWPSAQITLIASPVNEVVMRHHPFADVVLLYDKKVFFNSLKSGREFLAKLRSRRCDLAIVPATVSNSLTSNLLAYLSGAQVRIGASSLNGIEGPSSFLFNVVSALDWRDDVHRHQTLRNLDVLKPLDLTTSDLSLAIGLTESELRAGSELVASLRAKHGTLIGFHSGAGKIENRWPAERFVELANALCADGRAAAVITAGPKDDKPVAQVVHKLMCEHTVVSNQSIRLVAALISQLQLFVTNDTGVMHVAAATGTPTLSLFGPTDPLQWAPIGAKHRYVWTEDGRIDSIQSERVLEEAREMLSLAS
jgi:heptosyltransferase-2